MDTDMQLPYILEANTFFWNSASSSNQRRNNEQKRINEVKDFLTQIEFEAYEISDGVYGKKNDIEVFFHYTESSKNVYKSFKVYRNGKKSNIRIVKNLLDRHKVRKEKIKSFLKGENQ